MGLMSDLTTESVQHNLEPQKPPQQNENIVWKTLLLGLQKKPRQAIRPRTLLKAHAIRQKHAHQLNGIRTNHTTRRRAINVNRGTHLGARSLKGVSQRFAILCHLRGMIRIGTIWDSSLWYLGRRDWGKRKHVEHAVLEPRICTTTGEEHTLNCAD